MPPSPFRRACFFQPRSCFCFHSGAQHSVCSPLCRFVKAAFFAVLPIAIWLVLFSCAQFIPSSWRPAIAVDVLPALDELLFDNSLGLLSFSAILVAGGWLVSGSNFATLLVFMPLVLRGLRDLAAVPSTTGDVLAFLPYGLLHYISPAIFVLYLWWRAGVQTAVVFAQAFGAQNVLGVVTQVLFPTAAPWYNDLYGFAPATYSMPGNPGGLARVDKLFGTHMYSNAFNNSPLVFGAMPSLHSGFAFLIMLFAMHFTRRLGIALSLYVCWQWWATMYLRHHYMSDLMVGAAYATVTYVFSRRYLARASSSPAGFGGWSQQAKTSNGGYKMLDSVVTIGDKNDFSGRETTGMWNDAILKSRRAGDNNSILVAAAGAGGSPLLPGGGPLSGGGANVVLMTAPLEGVLVDNGH
ncbi:Aureobasidin resistance protein Aur1 [Geranomyces variabilis]|nr:Aureobasidin resistance protein Aur1 [Geranomyces variabilis]